MLPNDLKKKKKVFELDFKFVQFRPVINVRKIKVSKTSVIGSATKPKGGNSELSLPSVLSENWIASFFVFVKSQTDDIVQ